MTTTPIPTAAGERVGTRTFGAGASLEDTAATIAAAIGQGPGMYLPGAHFECITVIVRPDTGAALSAVQLRPMGPALIALVPATVTGTEADRPQIAPAIGHPATTALSRDHFTAGHHSALTQALSATLGASQALAGTA